MRGSGSPKGLDGSEKKWLRRKSGEQDAEVLRREVCWAGARNHTRPFGARDHSLMKISLPQVTYAFCKEFINLLEQHNAPRGNLDTTKVLVKLFQKVSELPRPRPVSRSRSESIFKATGAAFAGSRKWASVRPCADKGGSLGSERPLAAATESRH